MISCFKGNFKITSPRGYRTLGGVNQFHGGLDMVALDSDKSVYAVADGVIDSTLYEANGFGYYITQLLPDGRRIYYGHLKQGSFAVKAGQKVKVGDKLGVMGSTGNSTGAHTHVEMRVPGRSYESLDIAEFLGIPNKIGTYNAETSTLKEDLTVLAKAGIMNTPSYWENTAPKVQYLCELLHNMAKKLKEG